MVIVSSGFYKTHITTAAREASDRGILVRFFVGAYPTARLQRLLRLVGLAERGRISRLIERDEAIPRAKMRVLWLPEFLYEIAAAVTRPSALRRWNEPAAVQTFGFYGRLVARELRRVGPAARIYHFRAGFGQSSIELARGLGMHVICDHAIAHPVVMDELIRNRGLSARLSAGASPAIRNDLELSPAERCFLADVDASDSVLVNSEFAKATYVAMGWPGERVHVVYLGVDNNFLRAVGDVRREPATGTLRMLFAGRFEPRKGVDVLAQALADLDTVDWELLIAGPVTPEVRAAHGAFLDDARVVELGTLSRPELARLMLEVPVFVFPSYAEGSARAVFEALACGCYVITTPNSGSIVEDGVHGALIPPGDAEALTAAVEAADVDRERLAAIGSRNAAVVAARYRQEDYGAGLERLYRGLSGSTAVTPTQ
jgi:glycosyltransferase involved in cell wall biosynthesis